MQSTPTTMSRTYSICCDQCKRHIWVAQGSRGYGSFYSCDPVIMAALRDFLFDHQNHPLAFRSNEDLCGPMWEEFRTIPDTPQVSPTVTTGGKAIAESGK
jgi:hypothetical protein